MEYKKAEPLINDSYAVELKFMKDAYKGATQEWRKKIIKCLDANNSHNVLTDFINVPKSLVEEALNDKNICQTWKDKIREVFNIKHSYYNFDEKHSLSTGSFESPLFIGNGLTEGEELECLLSNMDDWDHEITTIKVTGTPYLKLKFKKK